MSVGSVLTQTAQVTGQHPTPNIDEKPGSNTGITREMLAMANAPDDFLRAVARHEANEDYNNDPTRTITSVVGSSIPFVDSIARGAFHSGTASQKVARAASTGSDWGVFTGAVWLYNKALQKVYDNVPGLKKFKEDHPTITFLGEVGSAVGVGVAAIKGYRKGVELLTGKTPEVLINQVTDRMKNSSEVIAKIFKPFEMIPNALRPYLGWGTFIVLGGIIAKNIFDVHNTKVKEDKRFEELKEQKYEATRALLDRYMNEESV